MNKYTELSAMGQKSFYGKAKLFSDFWNNKILYSYGTPVAILEENGTFVRLWDGYSATTMRHINSFRIQNGKNIIGKKEWTSMPVWNPDRYGL